MVEADRRHMLGFSFYGAGNLGDDLSIGGFLQEASQSRLGPFKGLIHSGRRAQAHRFSQVAWDAPPNQSYWEAYAQSAKSAASWIGVGDTPFQASSGAWFQRELDLAAETLRGVGRDIPKMMIGVGAEAGAIQSAASYHNILNTCDFIWTRDEETSEILEMMGFDPVKIRTAADMANLALAKIFAVPPNQDGREFGIAINYYSETASLDDITTLGDFVNAYRLTGRICFVSTEHRRRFERRIANQALSSLGIGRFLSGARRVPVVMPPYRRGALADLVAVFRRADIVLTSRYHGALAAAWAGCRVGVLARPSTKIYHLARQLNLPVLDRPFSASGLHDFAASAARVDRRLLLELARQAGNAVQELAAYMDDRP